jgi:AraC-like DNA-binding protein
MDSEETRTTKLFLAKGAALFAGAIADTEPHRHHAIQIVFGFDEAFEIQLGERKLRSNCIAIGSDVMHQFLGQEKPFLFFFAEPESDFGALMQQNLTAGYDLLDERKGFLESIRQDIFSKGLSVSTMKNSLRKGLSITGSMPVRDFRLTQVLSLIEEKPDRKISVPVLADAAGLSESRLQHLFKEQIGISMKRYMLWKRMIDGINFAMRGSDLTTAAYEAGFSDAAHMSRTFKEMFGINLSKIFENSRSIQVINEELV